MSYSIYDSRGYVAEVASGGGLADFCAAGESAAPGPETAALIADGSSDHPEILAEELGATSFPGESADSVREAIANAAKRCRDVAILTDGVGIEDPEEGT